MRTEQNLKPCADRVKPLLDTTAEQERKERVKTALHEWEREREQDRRFKALFMGAC